MKMNARIRITLDMPFDFTLDGVNEEGHDQSRIDAARYAESELITNLRTKLATENATIVDIIIEEVSE